jgi:quinol monooxygenase YgiN
MSEPVVFISHLRIKEGAAAGYTQLQREVTPQLEAEKPGTLVFLIYNDQAETRMTAIHVFADAQAMDAHFEGSEDRARRAFEFVEPDGWEIYGPASAAALEQMQRLADGAGVSLIVQPRYTSGFVRLSS